MRQLETLQKIDSKRLKTKPNFLDLFNKSLCYCLLMSVSYKFSDKSVLFMEENGFLLGEYGNYFTKLIEISNIVHEVTIDAFNELILITDIMPYEPGISININGKEIKKYLKSPFTNKDIIHSLLVVSVRDMDEILKISNLQRTKENYAFSIKYKSFKEDDFIILDD